MRFKGTNDRDVWVGFREAVMRGLPPSGGLYMPETIPRPDPELYRSGDSLRYHEIAFEILKPWTAGDLTDGELLHIVTDAYPFDAPLAKGGGDFSVLDLTQGPTYAFKDFGARFLARCAAKFARESGKRMSIVVATSGDTGGAVGSAFQGVPGVNVAILYPKGKVSDVQDAQLATFAGNVRAIAVRGDFDDCQRIAKAALADAGMKGDFGVTSANSISIARLAPQSAYYAAAAVRAREISGRRPLCFVVPSGNFGNITAGLFAKEGGAPIDSFIAATNANKTVPDYLASGVYAPRATVATLSNAMDVGAPSNFERLKDMYPSLESMRGAISSVSYTDGETMAALKEAKARDGIILDPHGAIAWAAWRDSNARKDGQYGIVLETAHPAKFGDTVRAALGMDPEMPRGLKEALSKPRRALECGNGVDEAFKAIRTVLEGE